MNAPASSKRSGGLNRPWRCRFMSLAARTRSIPTCWTTTPGPCPRNPSSAFSNALSTKCGPSNGIRCGKTGLNRFAASFPCPAGSRHVVARRFERIRQPGAPSGFAAPRKLHREIAQVSKLVVPQLLRNGSQPAPAIGAAFIGTQQNKFVLRRAAQQVTGARQFGEKAGDLVIDHFLIHI